MTTQDLVVALVAGGFMIAIFIPKLMKGSKNDNRPPSNDDPPTP